MQSILAIPYSLTAAMVSGTAPVAGTLANLVNNRVGQVARFSDAVGTYNIDLDLGTEQSVDCIAALWSNLRATDTVIISAGTAPGDDSLLSEEVDAYYSATRETSHGTKTLYTLPDPVTARYWRIALSVNTSVHPDGYCELSRVVLAKRQCFDIDYSQIELMPDDRGMLDQSDYGEDIEDIRRISFGLRVRWRFGTQAEAMASHQLLVMRGMTKPILFAPYCSDDTDKAQDFVAFGKCRNPARTGSQTYDTWELAFEIYSDAA
jgi:hypothetical protein